MALAVTDGVLTQYTPECGADTVTVPEGVTEIGAHAFQKSRITEIRFPSTLERIGEEAFRGCAALTGVTFPASVRLIGAGAFRRCDALRTVTFEGAMPEIRSCAFYDSAHIEEIRYGGGVMRTEPYFAEIGIPVRYSRVYPDLLLTGCVGYAYRDPLFRRMLCDYYEFAHARQTAEAFRKNAGSILAELGEQNDAEGLMYLLRHPALVPEEALRSAAGSDIAFVRLLLDLYAQTAAPETAETIRTNAYSVFLMLVQNSEDARICFLLEHDALLTEQALKAMLETAILAVQRGASAEYQMLVMRAVNRFCGTQQNRMQL